MEYLKNIQQRMKNMKPLNMDILKVIPEMSTGLFLIVHRVFNKTNYLMTYDIWYTAGGFLTKANSAI